jgi:hypothetical protein
MEGEGIAVRADRREPWEDPMERLLPAMMVSLLALPGCASVIDGAIDRAGDEASGVVVSAEDGAITIEGDRGSITLRGPTDQGVGAGPAGSAGVDAGTDLFADGFVAPNRLPDGLTIPVADGGTIEAGGSITESDILRMDVVLAYPASEKERLVAFYEEVFDDRADVTRADLGDGPDAVVAFLGNRVDRFVGVTIAPRGRDVVVHIEDVTPRP